MSEGGGPSYTDREKRVDKLRVSLFWVFVIAVLASLALAAWGWGEDFDFHAHSWPWKKVAQAGMLGLWIFLPPVWFWIEYFFGPWEKNPAFGDDPKSRFERLKYGQDISSKIWIAVSTVLLMLYFGKDIR